MKWLKHLCPIAVILLAAIGPVPGYLKLRFGEASRFLAGISFSFMTVLVCGVNMFAMAKVMQMLLG